MADLNKEIKLRLFLNDDDFKTALKELNAELKKLKQDLKSGLTIGDSGKTLLEEKAAVLELIDEYRTLRKNKFDQAQADKAAAEAQKKAIKDIADAEKKAAAAKKKADDDAAKASKEGIKFLEQQKKSAEAVQKVFEATAKAVIIASSTYIQFATASEDQGRLLTKLFQLLGLVQTVQETYNAVVAINTAIQEANSLAKIQNAAATTTVTAATTASTAATDAASTSVGLLTKVFSSLGIAGAAVTGVVLAGAAAYFVFRKSAEDVRIENQKLFETYKLQYEALKNNIESEIQLQKLRNPDKFAAEQKALQQRVFFSQKATEELEEQKKSYEDQIQTIFNLTQAAGDLNDLILSFSASGKKIFNADDKKQIEDFNKNILLIDEEIRTRQKDTEESKNKARENDINKEAELANIRLSALQEQLSLNKDIESRRKIALLALQQEINLNEAKLKIDKDDLAAQAQRSVLNAKFNNIEIEFQREKRLLLLEEFKIEAEIDKAKLNRLNNIDGKLQIIATDRIIAQQELNTEIANGLPAEEAIVKQKALELSYNESIFEVQQEINQSLLESQKTIEETDYQSLIDQLAVPTGDLAQDLENKLTSAGEASARAIVNIQNEINEKIIAAQGDDVLVKQLQKELKIRTDAEKAKAKITEDIIKKSNAVALAQEQLKEFQVRELQATTLKTELANINTTFERRKEINEELLKLQIERIRLQEEIDLKGATTDAEKNRIKETADFAIKEAERVTDETIQKDSIVAKLFGSPKDLQLFIDGTKKASENLKLVFSEFESTSELGDNFKAIGGSVAEVIDLASTLATTIKGFGKDTTLEEKTAAIAAAVGAALNSITNLIVDSLNATLDRQIENIDTALDELSDKKDLLEEDLNSSIERISELEKNLASAREGDRSRIVALIDQERSRELKLAQEKEKYFNQELALDAKRKELQKKQFENQKIASIIQATINTAVGVTSALIVPAPAGPILAAIVGALGAVQIGVIAAQPTPEFKQGGFTPLDNSDSTAVGVVHANEYVLSAPMVRSPRFKPLIEEAERYRLNGYQSGGLVTPFEQPNDTIQRTLETAIALSERPIFVQITAIEDALNDSNDLVNLTVL